MPTSSDGLRAVMRKWFGDIDLTGPQNFLESRGYKLTPASEWEKPTAAHLMNREEHACLSFLVEEWDYGGVVKAHLIPHWGD